MGVRGAGAAADGVEEWEAQLAAMCVQRVDPHPHPHPHPHPTAPHRTLHNGDAVGARHLARGVAEPGQLVKPACMRPVREGGRGGAGRWAGGRAAPMA